MRVVILLCGFAVIAANVEGNRPPSPTGQQHSGFQGGPFQNRIVGGRPAEEGESPFSLSLQSYGFPYCGASFIREFTSQGRHAVVTAAHCVTKSYDPQDTFGLEGLTLKGGSLSLNSSDSQVLAVHRIIVHPNYTATPDVGAPLNDIAIIILDGTFSINRNLYPIRLPAPSTTADMREGELVLFASGYGVTEEGVQSNVLKVVELSLVDNPHCKELYSAAFGEAQVIFDSNICAGEEKGGKGSCNGDSGGPLIQNPSSPLLVGVSTWFYECGHPRFPGVYTRISAYTTWITTTIREYDA